MLSFLYFFCHLFGVSHVLILAVPASLFPPCLYDLSELYFYSTRFLHTEPEVDPGRVDCPALKPIKATLFTMIVYNLENSIRDIRPFYHQLFCHSSVMKYASSCTVVNP